MSGPIVIAGGGTGGHVFVAEAVSLALQDEGITRDELRFVGSSRGQERDLLADSGIEMVLLAGRGIKRSFAPRALLDNLGAILGLLAAMVRALWVIGRWRPRAVVSVGGYAAVPAGLAAALLRRPLVLVNIDAAPGLAHRILGRVAARSCVAFEGTPLPGAVVTGAPVRPVFEDLDRTTAGRASARAQLGCDPDRPFVVVSTGSLGARSVNRAVLALAERWADRPVTLYHVTGRRDIEEIEQAAPTPTPEGLRYVLVPFEDHMELAYAAADAAVTRAGALTIAELSLVGLPAILVPLPGAPGDHQTENARSLERAGGGICVADAALSAQLLDEELSSWLAEPDRLEAMEQAARALGHPHAARNVAQVVIDHGR